MNSLTFYWATQTSITVKNAYKFLQVYSEECLIWLCICNDFKPQALKTLISKIDQKKLCNKISHAILRVQTCSLQKIMCM